jgi:hypothetical protein
MKRNYLYVYESNSIINFNDDEVMNKLYYLEAHIPTKENIANAKMDKSISSFFEKYDYDKCIRSIKKSISQTEEWIPMYDIYSENVYLVSKFDVYHRTIYQFYRFPEQKFYDNLQLRVSKKITSNADPIVLRKIRKMNLMIDFLSNFDLKILEDTFIKVFYKYSDLVGKNILLCRRPSFNPIFYHLKPYYTRPEVINIALNMGIQVESKYLTSTDVNKLCETIQQNDVSSNMLVKHNKYIVSRNMLGLAQYYTIQGSYFMNQYLRNNAKYTYRNDYLESLIRPMWEMTREAPGFDKSYTFYRFVTDDSYLSGIDIGDLFTESGFMSTTRDPFYRSDLYEFGSILIKIKVPSNVVGVALCIETVSHFPNEQEIIFPPRSRFKLISRDSDCKYYHVDNKIATGIKTKYEFEWYDNLDIIFAGKTKFSDSSKITDFLAIESENTITVFEQIKIFISIHVNKLFQMKTKIGNKEFVNIVEWYDSTGAYQDFYAIKTDTGLGIYTLYDGYLLYMIEIGETDTGRQMHVNYYVKYNTLNKEQILDENEFIKFLSTVANYFTIDKIYIYAEYNACSVIKPVEDTHTGSKNMKQRGFEKSPLDKDNPIEIEKVEVGGNYCNDFINYLSNGTKRFAETKILYLELQPKFSYYDLDLLKTTPPTRVLDKRDRDDLYQIYDKIYKLNESNKNTIAEFILWIIKNRCYLIEQFITKLRRLYRENNPFFNDYYILDPNAYLYNRKLIKTYNAFTDLIYSADRKMYLVDINMYRDRK